MDEVASTLMGSGVLKCIQCGRCTSSCPVSRLTAEHNPRRLMEMVILGFREAVLSGRLPWYCLSCFTCLDRCPQGGDIGEVMFTIRNLATREGNVPSGIVTQAESLIKTGRIVNPTGSIINRRESLGLPKIPSTATEDAQKIIERTGFDKIIDFIKGRKK